MAKILAALSLLAPAMLAALSLLAPAMLAAQVLLPPPVSPPIQSWPTPPPSPPASTFLEGMKTPEETLSPWQALQLHDAERLRQLWVQVQDVRATAAVLREDAAAEADRLERLREAIMLLRQWQAEEAAERQRPPLRKLPFSRYRFGAGDVWRGLDAPTVRVYGGR